MSSRRILSNNDVARIRELRYQDGLTSPQVASIIGCSASAVKKHAPGMLGKVSNMMLREAFTTSGLTASEVARRLGWCDGRKADASRVRRTLGLRPSHRRADGTPVSRVLMDVEIAGLMAEAIGVAPWEIIEDESTTRGDEL